EVVGSGGGPRVGRLLHLHAEWHVLHVARACFLRVVHVLHREHLLRDRRIVLVDLPVAVVVLSVQEVLVDAGRSIDVLVAVVVREARVGATTDTVAAGRAFICCADVVDRIGRAGRTELVLVRRRGDVRAVREDRTDPRSRDEQVLVPRSRRPFGGETV